MWPMSIAELDGYIEKLLKCEYLTEDQVATLCNKVRGERICAPSLAPR